MKLRDKPKGLFNQNKKPDSKKQINFSERQDSNPEEEEEEKVEFGNKKVVFSN